MKKTPRFLLCVATTSALIPAAAVFATDDSTPSTTVGTTTTIASSNTDANNATPSTTTTLPPLQRPRLRNVKIAYARVVLDEQRAYFFNSQRRLIATLEVSTGLNDETPVGVFRVFSKSAQTFYTPNPRERMRFMTRFTKGREGGNIGFHGIPYVVTKTGERPFYTPLGIAPSSHGCIRMRVNEAKWVFNNMDIGATVAVVRTRG